LQVEIYVDRSRSRSKPLEGKRPDQNGLSNTREGLMTGLPGDGVGMSKGGGGVEERWWWTNES